MSRVVSASWEIGTRTLAPHKQGVTRTQGSHYLVRLSEQEGARKASGTLEAVNSITRKSDLALSRAVTTLRTYRGGTMGNRMYEKCGIRAW